MKKLAPAFLLSFATAVAAGTLVRATYLGGAAAALHTTAPAQQLRKYRIGYLSSGAGSASPRLTATFSETLRTLGWVEGKNIVFVNRTAGDHVEQLPILAQELVRLDVDVIVANGTLAPLAAKRATATIPIVMTGAGNPVRSGLVASLARPGANVTGLSVLESADLTFKRLQLLKDADPPISRVAYVRTTPTLSRALEAGASAMGLNLLPIVANSPAELNGTAKVLPRIAAEGLMVSFDPFTFANRRRIAEIATTNHLPSISAVREYAEAGVLMSYGPDQARLRARAASYVDKILRGAKPGELPVEEPTKLELVINLKTARALGLTIPLALLARADQVIE